MLPYFKIIFQNFIFKVGVDILSGKNSVYFQRFLKLLEYSYKVFLLELSRLKLRLNDFL